MPLLLFKLFQTLTKLIRRLRSINYAVIIKDNPSRPRKLQVQKIKDHPPAC